MKDKGIITEEEFSTQKQALLKLNYFLAITGGVEEYEKV
jgi:hypothetical protein